MSYENVKAHFARVGMEARLVMQETITDTVEHAAATIGCEPGRIAKTMSFLCKDGPMLIVMAGDARISNPKYKARFGQKASMIPGDRVEELIGHAPGGVCPFGIPQRTPVYLDVSMKRFADVYAAAGHPAATAHLTLEELERLSGSLGWVDVCKDWE